MDRFTRFAKSGEDIEDLMRDGLFILKKRGGFSYGNDAVALSDFVRAKRGERIVDIGAGTGILSMLVHAKYGARMTAVDIQSEMCDMLRRSVLMNSLADAIDVVCGDIRERIDGIPSGAFDAAVCNPPYFSSGERSRDEQVRASVHDDMCSLADAVGFAKRALKNGGRLFVSYPAAHIEKLMVELSRNGFSAKRLRFVYSKRGKEPYLLLAEAKKGGGAGLRYDPDLILEEEN